MHQVKVSRLAMIERVKANRDQHRAVVLEALDGYRVAVIQELDKMIQTAKEGKKIVTTVELVQPEDHTRDYNRVLDMLDLSVDAEITLSAIDFNRYMRDEWEWDAVFASSNSRYVKSQASINYLGTKSL